MDTTPIIVRFLYQVDRDRFLSSTYRLKALKIIIRTDFPVVLKKTRGRLASIAYKMRQEKHMLTRIRVMDTTVVLEMRHSKTEPWKIVPGINLEEI